MIKKYFLVKNCVLVFLFLSGLFFGQTNTWTGTVDSNWNNAGNWTGNKVPLAADAVIIPKVANNPIVSVNNTCASITFTGTAAKLTVNSGITLTVTGEVMLTSLQDKDSEAEISGSGTINTLTVTVGTQDNIKSGGVYTSKVNSTINNLNVSGNINIWSNAHNINRRNDAAFYFQSGTINLLGKIETTNDSGNVSTFSMASGAQSGTLVLGNANAFNLSATGTNVINLNGTGSTVNYNGADQNVRNTAYNNLSFSGSGVKSTSNTTSVAGNLYINNGVKASVAAGTNINAGSLTLGVYKKINGTWGSSSSPATYKDNVYFQPTTGTVTVTNDTRPTAVFSNLTASQSICFGTSTTTFSGTVSSGGVYPLPNETVSVTINGTTQTAIITGAAGAFSVNFNTATLPSNTAPYTVTYSFANTANVNFKAVTDTSTTILVNKTPVGGGVYSGNTPICLNGSTGNMTLGGGYVGTVVRWEKRLNNAATWTAINNTATVYSENPSVSGTWEYRAVVGSGNCPEVASQPFSVVVNPSLFITVADNTPVTQFTSTVKLPYSSNNGTEYDIVFDSAALSAGFANANGNISGNTGSLVINVPYCIGVGSYQAKVRVRTSYPVCASEYYPFTITVNPITGPSVVQSEQIVCTGNLPNNLILNNNTEGVIKWQKSLNAAFSNPQDIPVASVTLPSSAIGVLTQDTYFRAIYKYGGCDKIISNTVMIKVVSAAVAPTIITTSPTCSSAGSAKIQDYASGNNYLFSPSGPSVASGGVITGMIFGTSYTVALNNGSCNSPASSPFSVAAQLTTPLSPTVSTTSPNCSAQGTATITNYVATNTYTFSPMGPSVGSGGVISGVTPGTDYTVTASNGNCASTASAPFKVAPQLAGIIADVNIAATSTAICAGTGVTFTATPTNGGTAPTYQWQLNNVNITGATSATYSTSTLNNGDKVTVVMTSNASPCLTGSPATSNTIILTVNPLPTASVTGNTQICKNSDAVFTLTGTPGATVTYSINGGSNSTVVLAGGTALVKVSSAMVSQTLNVVSVSNGTCNNPVLSSATVTVGADSVFSGTGWSNGLPSGNGLNAVISGNYNTSSGNIKACSCTIQNGGALTVSAGTSIEVVNSITNLGTLTVESDGNLIQHLDTPNPVNSGDIKVKRNIKFRNDNRQEYNYLISPVMGQSLKTIYPGVPTTATYPYVLYYNEANNYFYNSSGAYIAGRGLAVKEPSKADVPADNMDAVFTGVPGNGVISFPLAHTNSAQYGYNLVGNPYPSNIDLQKLYALNSGKITSTFHFWDNGANNVYTQQGSGYNGRAYAAYNAANDTGNKAGYLLDSNPANAIGAKLPNKTAKVGQGFMVRATGTGNLVFNNTIRTSNNAGAGFFSKATQSPADRYWLRLVTPANAVNTMAVVYFEGGSNAFGMDDSGMNGDSSDMLYSLAEGNKLQIEGKPLFDVNDKIILGSRHFAAGNYTFALDRAEGVFANGQRIYLKDKQTGIITNLSEGSYTFAANAGESTGRFEIIYQSETVLATDGTVKDDVVVYRDGEDFVISSKGDKITRVEVYDSSGRLSLKTEPGSLKTVIPAVSLSNGVYILKISQGGKITNRKIIR